MRSKEKSTVGLLEGLRIRGSRDKVLGGLSTLYDTAAILLHCRRIPRLSVD